MPKNDKKQSGGLVYSTNKDFYNYFHAEEPAATLAPGMQKLRIKLDTKQRAGKIATLIDGFVGTQPDLEQLAKQLKNKCGTGGSAKDGQIIIQGDYKDKITAWLKEWGYSQTK